MTKKELLRKIIEYVGVGEGFITSPNINHWLDTYISQVKEGKFESFSDYVGSKEITLAELKKNFDEVDSIQGNFDMTSCPRCNTGMNSKRLASEPWTRVRYCWQCKAIYCLCEQDRMSGARNDVLLTFKERKI